MDEAKLDEVEISLEKSCEANVSSVIGESMDSCMAQICSMVETDHAENEIVVAESYDARQGPSSPSTPEDQQSSDSNYKSDFEAFLQFTFPEDVEFNASGDINDPFYFESDHVALKSNEDYRRLLRAFVMLESQRSAALRDLDELLKLQKKALGDPVRFAQDLCRGSMKEKFPAPRRIVELPSISWEQYTDDVESVLSSFGGSHHMTRQKQRRELMNGIRQCVEQSIVTKSEPAADDLDKEGESRPATFNQSWSVEEQRKLENLLKKYPPERFESRRWAKIARELPGRTTQQVASRVQKYFIKLARAGLPVPGRMPNVAAYGGKISANSMHRHQRYNRFLYPSSTFMTSYEPPVYMSDDDDNEPNTESRGSGHHVSDIAPCLHETPEYRQLQALLAVQRQLRRGEDEVSESSGVKLEPGSSEQPRSSYIDPDYASSTTGISNYLDPNYMPAAAVSPGLI